MYKNKHYTVDRLKINIDLTYGKYASNMNEVRLNLWRIQHKWTLFGYGLWITYYKWCHPDEEVRGFKMTEEGAVLITHPRQV